MDSDLCFLPISILPDQVARRRVSPVEIVTALLDRIDRSNAGLCSYITVCAESALAAARQAEREIHAGQHRGPLHGIPIAQKDINLTRGVRTTAHSRTLIDYVPDHDATHVRRLAEAGMPLIGKTNTTEFAIGTMDIFGTSRNPWDLSRYTGGSSGGSGNAVAAGLAVAATGSDTGGSIRIPASFCGIVGMMPTYGRVSRYGVIPLSWSMDRVGPMCRTVADCAVLLQHMAGHDPLDPTSSRRPVPDYHAELGREITDIALGVPRQHFFERLDPEVDTAVQTALRRLEALGARLEPLDLPRACAASSGSTGSGRARASGRGRSSRPRSIRRRCRYAPCGRRNCGTRYSVCTPSSCPPCRFRHFLWRPKTRFRPTPLGGRSRSTCPDTRRLRFPADSRRRGCPSGCSSSAESSTRGRSFASPTRTSNPSNGISAGRSWR